MFDVGFSEMLVIGIVALVVIGPERLPKVARTIGHLMGRAQRYVNDVKRDIDREMQIEELRKLQEQMQETARSIETSVNTQVSEVKSGLEQTHAAVEGHLSADMGVQAVAESSMPSSPTPEGASASGAAGPMPATAFLGDSTHVADLTRLDDPLVQSQPNRAPDSEASGQVQVQTASLPGAALPPERPAAQPPAA